MARANREAVKVNSKIYREANPEKVKTSTKAWRKANPKRCREHHQKRRALKYQTQTEPINDKLVFLRDGWICQICHKKVDKRFKYPNPMSGSLDHIMPLSRGGSHTYKNVQLTHLTCNLSKQARLLPQGEQLRIL